MSDAMAEFARAHVLGREDLPGAEAVPPALWRAFGAAGLFRIGLPEAYGGSGGGYREIQAAARSLARLGGIPGLALSWSLQVQAARFLLLGFANEAQKQAWLPRLASGAVTIAVAISEPEVGAHPKHLTTRARAADGSVVLEGRKHWLTNGPMADLFVVLAISAEEAGRKRYSAYLVPRDSAGLETVAMPPLDFLRPSPHCGLVLQGCRVPREARLGPEGGAWEAMARPLRDVEDALICGTLAGAMGWQLDRLAGRSGDTADEAEALGALVQRLAVLEAVAERAAAALDAAPLDRPPEARLAGGFRLAAADFQTALVPLARGSAGDLPLERVTRDIDKALGIARAAHAARRRTLGRALSTEQAKPG